MRHFTRLLIASALLGLSLLTACNKTEQIPVEDLLDETLFITQERGNIGRFGCYELLFPVSFTMPDNSTIQADSYEDIREALRTFFANNPGNPRRYVQQMQYVFPLNVINAAGEVLQINDANGLQRLRTACAGTYTGRDFRGFFVRGAACFDVVFPLTIVFPDELTVTVQDREAFRQAIRRWYAANPEVSAPPTLGFPFAVKLHEDGTTVRIQDRQMLQRLKESCN